MAKVVFFWPKPWPASMRWFVRLPNDLPMKNCTMHTSDEPKATARRIHSGVSSHKSTTPFTAVPLTIIRHSAHM